MKSAELTIGRTFAVAFDHGDDFFGSLAEFCRANNLRQGFIPMFIAGLAEVEIVGACEKLADPEAPVWSKVHLERVEALGAGTLAYDPETGNVSPHIHVSVGEKARSAAGFTSHLLTGRVQFLTEMIVTEVVSPEMTRPRNPNLYDVPLLTFGTA